MTRFRDFDAARAEAAGEPLRFRLGGRDFETMPEIPAGAMLALARSADQELNADALKAFGAFLDGVVIPEQREALWESLSVVGLATLFELVQWIIEESTGRPLPSASSSAEQPPTDGAQSRVVSLSRVSEAHSA